MSHPLPHIQALSTYKSDRQTPSALRNSSSPFSLAIPQRNVKPALRSRQDTSSLHLPSIRTDDASSIYSNATELVEFPKRPKKAVLINEKPIFPPNSPYKHITKSTSTISLELNYATRHKPKKVPLLKRPINDRVLAFAVTIAIAVFLAITIPLGVILPQKYIVPLPVNILLPFYVDPVDGAWQRLMDTVVKHHDTKFTVILNPRIIPGGNTSFPPTYYMQALKALNVYDNVCTIGYIDTNYGKRDNASVRAEIAYYAAWTKTSPELALHGVYFDRTPWQNDKNGTNVAYMRNITLTARHDPNWADGREGLVVQNPGRLPNASFTAEADMTVVFDAVYGVLPPNKEAVKDMVKDGGASRDRYAMMIEGVPTDLKRGGLRKIVELVRRDVEWVYFTDVVDDMGSSYSSFWDEWMDIVF